MNTDFQRILTLFRIEMRMILRDRRTVFASILLPLLITPLMIFSSSATNKHREAKLAETTYLYAITGTNAEFARSLANEARRVQAESTPSTNRFLFTETNTPAPLTALEEGRIHFILEGSESSLAGKTDNTNRSAAKGLGTTHSIPGVRLIFRANQVESSTAMHRMSALLDDTQKARQAAMLRSVGIPIRIDSALQAQSRNVASNSQVAGLSMGRHLTLLLLFFVLMGGMVVASDMLAGEKERGTLETLLTTSISRNEITSAKLLAITTVAVAITFLQSVNLLVYASLKFLPLPPHFAEALPPPTVLLLFLLFAPVAALASGILLLTSGYAKSYKETQLYFMPVFLLLLAPALAPFLPGLELRSAIVVVPISNVAVAVRDILVGKFDWPMIALSWFFTAAAAMGVARATSRLLSDERRTTVSESDAIDYRGGQALFARQAPIWFAVMWGLLLIISNEAPKMDLRLQLFINLIVIFFGASLLMIRKYKLDPRVTLALRMPKPAAFLAVLIGVPGGLLTGVGLFRLGNLFFPVNEKTMEAFANSIMPSNMGIIQIVFFMAVLPGIFEEITFRGILLHALRRRLHPALLVVVVGLVFGFLQLDVAYYLAGPVLLGCAFWILWKNRTPYPDIHPWRRPKSPSTSRQEPP
jgi:sodium transport system permease protein